MKSNSKILQVTSYIGGSLLTIGILIFLYGAFVSSLTTTVGIGIGIVMGAVFVFIMGIFLVVRGNDYGFQNSKKRDRLKKYVVLFKGAKL